MSTKKNEYGDDLMNDGSIDWGKRNEQELERARAAHAESMLIRKHAREVVAWLRKWKGEGVSDRATRVLVAQDIEDIFIGSGG